MSGQIFEAKTFEDPEDRMMFPHGHADVVNADGHRLVRVTFEPGFRWSEDMAPSVGTALCQVRHVFWVLSGRLGLGLPDGAHVEVEAGGLISLAPDHDSWTIGDEPVTFLDIDPIAPRS